MNIVRIITSERFAWSVIVSTVYIAAQVARVSL